MASGEFALEAKATITSACVMRQQNRLFLTSLSGAANFWLADITLKSSDFNERA